MARGRKKPVVQGEPLIEWEMISGGTTLKNIGTFSKGDRFMATERDVPEAFRDIIRKVKPDICTRLLDSEYKEARDKIYSIFTID